jgi:small subunit ribosomal protein S1
MNKIAINDLGTVSDFLKAIDESIKNYRVDDSVTGTVVQIDREGILVDIGCKTEAYVPKKEISAKRVFDIHDLLSVGQQVEGKIIRIEDGQQYILSMKEAEEEILWNTIEDIWNSEKKIVFGEITRVVKGGMIVDIGVRAFLPISQSFINKSEDLSKYIGYKVDAKIIQFNREKGSVVISRKAYVDQEQKEEKAIQFKELEVGKVYKGRVSGIVEFGVFVFIGLLSGLIHKTKMGSLTPNQFTIGDEIEVEVLEIDIDKDRLSLAFEG